MMRQKTTVKLISQVVKEENEMKNEFLVWFEAIVRFISYNIYLNEQNRNYFLQQKNLHRRVCNSKYTHCAILSHALQTTFSRQTQFPHHIDRLTIVFVCDVDNHLQDETRFCWFRLTMCQSLHVGTTNQQRLCQYTIVYFTEHCTFYKHY